MSFDAILYYRTTLLVPTSTVRKQAVDPSPCTIMVPVAPCHESLTMCQNHLLRLDVPARFACTTRISAVSRSTPSCACKSNHGDLDCLFLQFTLYTPFFLQLMKVLTSDKMHKAAWSASSSA